MQFLSLWYLRCSAFFQIFLVSHLARICTYPMVVSKRASLLIGTVRYILINIMVMWFLGLVVSYKKRSTRYCPDGTTAPAMNLLLICIFSTVIFPVYGQGWFIFEKRAIIGIRLFKNMFDILFSAILAQKSKSRSIKNFRYTLLKR